MSMTRDQAVKAVVHHDRRRIVKAFLALEGGQAIGPLELAEKIGKPLPNISYHVKVLRDDCAALALKREEPRRGAVAHFYAIKSPKARAQLAAAMQFVEGR